MAKLTPYQLADIFSTAYQNAQQRKQQQEIYAQEKAWQQRQSLFEVTRLGEKAIAKAQEELVPYDESMEIAEGSTPFKGSEYEKRYKSIMEATGIDIVPDDQLYVYKKDIIQPKSDTDVYSEHSVKPDGEGGYEIVLHEGYEKLHPKTSKSDDRKKVDLDEVRSTIAKQYVSYENAEDPKIKKIQFNLLKNKLNKLSEGANIKSKIEKVKRSVKDGSDLQTAISEVSGDLDETQVADLELYFDILPPEQGEKLEMISPRNAGLMARNEFIKDFEQDQGRKPTEKELERAKGKYWK